jgi:hypothetical protein
MMRIPFWLAIPCNADGALDTAGFEFSAYQDQPTQEQLTLAFPNGRVAVMQVGAATLYDVKVYFEKKVTFEKSGSIP